MQVAVIGLPFSGKSTVFDLICLESTGKILEGSSHHDGLGARHATVPISDPRLTFLHEKHADKKMVTAAMDLMDFPPLQIGHKEAHYAELVASMSKCDALIIVVRAFENDAYPHPLGSVASERDIREVLAELEVRDLEIIENRIDKLRKSVKKPTAARAMEEQELALLGRLLRYFEEKQKAEGGPDRSGPPLRSEGQKAEGRDERAGDGGGALEGLSLTPDEERMVRGFQLFRLKPRCFVLNIGEEAIGKESQFSEFTKSHPGTGVVSCRIELEVASLPDGERETFASEYGLVPGIGGRMLREWLACFGCMTFYTIGKDEVRAWVIPKGTGAVGAAGKIHTDIARGFISAEVVRFEDFKRLGSMKDAKSQGCMRLEGRDYVVQDGDIIYFRFNV